MIHLLSFSCRLAAICMFLFGIVAQSHATPTASMRAHLTRIWQEEFGKGSQSTTNPFNSFSTAQPDWKTLEAPQLVSSSYTPPTASSSNSSANLRQASEPHPAVVRIIVPEEGATSYGSGTLVDIRDKFALVITNWHVVRDASGPVEVIFPGGFTSQARALKVDPDWDLAALVIWRPPVEPVRIATVPPRPGDELTICGYGQGMYRCATGRCTDYYAPRPNFPRQMVELDVEARQGDSGGPIFNSQGELAGVLFGAGQGTTLGSFGGRVDSFLATLAPDIGQPSDHQPNQLADFENSPVNESRNAVQEEATTAIIQPHVASPAPLEPPALSEDVEIAEAWSSDWPEQPPAPQQVAQTPSSEWQSIRRTTLFEQVKTALAAVGLLAIAVLVLRAAR